MVENDSVSIFGGGVRTSTLDAVSYCLTGEILDQYLTTVKFGRFVAKHPRVAVPVAHVDIITQSTEVRVRFRRRQLVPDESRVVGSNLSLRIRIFFDL